MAEQYLLVILLEAEEPYTCIFKHIVIRDVAYNTLLVSAREDLHRRLARYLEAITGAYPALPDGTVLLPFPRLFIVATR